MRSRLQKTNIAICFMVAAVCLMSFGNDRGWEDKMSPFKWLVGTWTAKHPDGKLMETWLPMNDSIYTGQTTLYKRTTEFVSLEAIQLIKRNKDYYYIPTVTGQNAVEFKVTKFTRNSFVAENPAHDFPKKISYILYKKDSLHAIIEGGGKKQDYYYGRVKRETVPTPKTK